ncbi:BTB/POZ domain-containing adapter for CUL3-mediated RhoA degradation protein 3 isoform X2 [Hippocampus zosterae]|uniref:BTB/POZ domain-containing adapter for CUL3-mediated RhoA degradation protein 3 isoform X2 n=1 Tax=Hippocampus zosterae TaxID=109293 RepID=UPI00223D0FCD|nr:BTB/POZ domain-containing adapter for CUL3-mediated RhoA degradation protein 3 isoform X2 [Hippocampus zosterae]
MEEMSGESAVSPPVPAATTRTTSFKGSSPSSKYVKLNVGGALYYTTMQTLTKQDTMLKAMFSGRMEVLTDSEGWILIDRCGKHFGTILNYLRDGAVPLPDSRRETEELLAEAKYYLVQGLADECTAALQNKETYEPLCKVPLMTSSKEEQKLIATSNKPTVKLLYNRSNNKYSYTRWSSLKLASMRRPSISFYTNPTMGGGQTTLCWRQQGALPDDPTIWTKMMSENELSEFVGSISNDPTTAHTITSDLPPVLTEALYRTRALHLPSTAHSLPGDCIRV